MSPHQPENIMRNFLKELRNKLNGKSKVIVVDEEFMDAHLCQRTEWKEGIARLCEVCRGESMDFRFKNREAFELAQSLKEKQMEIKAG